MAVQLVGFARGMRYFFCHSGGSRYPLGGLLTNKGQTNVVSSNQSFSSGFCSGRSENMWIGLQATDGHADQMQTFYPATHQLARCGH